MMDKRPKLNIEISLVDFKEFYWLKKELTSFCKEHGLKMDGSKIELTEKIINFLKTGQKPKELDKLKAVSKFDWKTEKLTLETLITDNYKNTQNARCFFEKEIGSGFKFNVQFMNWMKSNSGKTLGDSIEEWKRLMVLRKSDVQPKKIAPQFEFNRYVRDFLAANPALNRDAGIKSWKIKKSMRGDNVYKNEDLKFLEKK